ncbi:MAG: cupin-like domain-containing protein [Nostocales cyanobacterium]|nr:MAG: cupin-like domain-containing protein [Nostocales cyanobacterium]TAF19451.1 MAG: cupin-like domain-containing protein [Nostocales cyanobacterium]
MTTTLENPNLQNSGNTISRINRPTLAELKQATKGFNKPVIITDTITEWKAFKSWSIEYLNQALNNKEIKISISNNKIFTFTAENDYILLSTEMKFNDFTNWILNGDRSEKSYYLYQTPIDQSFPELLPDIQTPEYIKKGVPLLANLWIGTGGNISPLHWDSAQNLLCQVRGRKRILLFEPKQTEFLYPFPANSKIPHMSQVKINDPDLNKFPKFASAKYTECTIEAGEMLFIPPFWWHQVYSLDQLNIAINFWWQIRFKDYFTPQARRILANSPQQVWYLIKSIFSKKANK